MSARHAPQPTKSFAQTPGAPIYLNNRRTPGRIRGLNSSPGHAPAAGHEIVRDQKMSNPVVLITGGLTGIGRAAAMAFAKKGAKVVVAGRRDEAGKALVKE